MCCVLGSARMVSWRTHQIKALRIDPASTLLTRLMAEIQVRRANLARGALTAVCVVAACCREWLNGRGRSCSRRQLLCDGLHATRCAVWQLDDPKVPIEQQQRIIGYLMDLDSPQPAL